MFPEKFRRLFYSRRLRGPFLPDEGHCWTAPLPQWRHLADSPETPQRSTLTLYENGVPFLEPHEPHQYIRTEGGGLFSHWQDSLFFSTSDNSDPNTNGRRYNYTVSPEFYRPRYRLRGPFLPNEGHCWTAQLPQWNHLADSSENPQRSPLMLYENGVPSLEAHVPHHYIRTEGGGLFSHWQDFLFFSTSDNSDPNTNGRRYNYTVSPEFYRVPTRVWSDSLPTNLSGRDAGPEAIARDVAYALDAGHNILGWLSEFGEIRGKVILEIGPGINFGPILFLACHGAIPVVADRFLAPWDAEYHPQFYRRLRDELRRQYPELDLRPIDALLDSGTYCPDVLSRVESSSESLNLNSNSVDIVISNAVLEHLENHPQAFFHLYRITRPGGWGIHQVDFRYHRSFDRPLEHLLLSPSDYELVAGAFRENGTYLRPFDMADLFTASGFEVRRFSPNLFASPEYLQDILPRLRKARKSRYRATSKHKLRMLGGLFIVCKPLQG
jgi:SAM-dependent methyltransferase